MLKKIIILCSILFSIVTTINTQAGTVTTAPKATATLNSNCKVSSTDLNFGTLVMSVNNYSTFSVNVLCTRNTAYTIGVDLGANSPRQMKGVVSNQYISYRICTVAWSGSGCVLGTGWNTASNIAATGDGVVVSSTGTGSTQTFTGYGGALVNYPTPDTYIDTSTVVITY